MPRPFTVTPVPVVSRDPDADPQHDTFNDVPQGTLPGHATTKDLVTASPTALPDPR